MRIAIATDAWYPQTNGVVTTLSKTAEALESLGHDVLLLTPEPFKSVPLPTYKSIRLAILPGRRTRKMLEQYQPDAVHVATEGPIGLAVRRYCIRKGIPFTTSYHTQFPQYIRMRAPIPVSWSYAFLRWFHSRAARTMVPSESQRKELENWQFKNVRIWSRGVNTTLFKPRDGKQLQGGEPIFIYAGRVAVEKSLDEFLKLDLPGKKYVVGDGPDMDVLKGRYPDAVFTGFKYGEELVGLLSSADVFVFPSRTDTFGLVMLEAMACGVPVAAFPVTGPIDVIKQGVTGVMMDDLGEAALQALELDSKDAREYALRHTWEDCTRQFVTNLEPVQSCSKPATQQKTSC
jgi:glycosyltransferase involved in cell wall biosynthesis